jgi:hypothetical protein
MSSSLVPKRTIAGKVLHPEVAGRAAATGRLLDILIDITVDANAERGIAGVLGPHEPDFPQRNADDEERPGAQRSSEIEWNPRQRS